MNLKICNRLLSFMITTLLLLFSTDYVTASTLTDFERYLNTKQLTDCSYEEYINGVRYTYVVENGEAAIVHIFSNYAATGKQVLELPLSLGGYPVTTLGHPEGSLEVFCYFNDGEDVSDSFPGYSDADKSYIEYDIGLRGKTLVIPEGYEKITYYAMNGFMGYVEFPKSL
ncbi:MAG: hypothetical protein IJ261_01815, partial [Clostridia bacterium]|nr:hypothetical protein [Clostridia bacterium]